MKEDKQLLVLTHLSQLIILITGLDQQAKEIINFQISLIIYVLLCIPLILLFGLGLLGFIVLGISSIIFPIINAMKVNNDETPNYPFVFTILK